MEFSEDVNFSSPDIPLKETLAHVPFSDIQKVCDRIGKKKFNELLRCNSEEEVERDSKMAPSTSKRTKCKDEPQELFSKKPVTRWHENLAHKGKRQVDPRFNERCGDLNEHMFQKSYAFVDEIRKQEIGALKEELKKSKSNESKTEISKLLRTMETREANKLRQMEKKQLQKEHRRVEHKLRKSGKRAFYFKRGMVRKIELAQKYQKLKKERKIDQYMEKRRKRNAQRDRKSLPNK